MLRRLQKKNKNLIKNENNKRKQLKYEFVKLIFK